MTWRVVIDFSQQESSPALIHKIRNFGEDLWRACQRNGWSSISLNDVDGAIDYLTVVVRSYGRVQRTRKMVEELLTQHFLAEYARISEVNDHTAR